MDCIVYFKGVCSPSLRYTLNVVEQVPRENKPRGKRPSHSRALHGPLNCCHPGAGPAEATPHLFALKGCLVQITWIGTASDSTGQGGSRCDLATQL